MYQSVSCLNDYRYSIPRSDEGRSTDALTHYVKAFVTAAIGSVKNVLRPSCGVCVEHIAPTALPSIVVTCVSSRVAAIEDSPSAAVLFCISQQHAGRWSETHDMQFGTSLRMQSARS